MTFEAKIDDDGIAVEVEFPSHPSARSRGKKPILIVLHQEHSTPSHVGRTLTRHGHALDIRKPRFGDPLPDTLAEHDGAVIFGGPMSANDTNDFIRRETEWINVALKENKPFLGICLGAQMLANFLGARVYRDAYARAEIGYHGIIPHASPIHGVPWPKRVYQWHRDGFDLPAGAELLASAESPYPNQAFQYGTAVAIQFHPEISFMQVNKWSANTNHRLKLPGAQQRPHQLSDHLMHAPRVHRWLDAYLRSWVAMGHDAGHGD